MPLRRTTVVISLGALAVLGCRPEGSGGEPSPATGAADTSVADSSAASPGTAAELWSIPDSVACRGLTLGWSRPLPELRRLVGGVATPLQTESGHGVLSLFVTSCPSSRIEGRDTGPFSLAVWLVPLAPPASAADSAAGGFGAAILSVLGAEGSPVLDLFRRHGFAVSPATVSLELAEARDGGARAVAVLQASGSLVRGEAQLADSSRQFRIRSALVAAGRDPTASFAGEESAVRRYSGSAQVRTTGAGALPAGSLDPSPATVALDTDFRWSFTFAPRRR